MRIDILGLELDQALALLQAQGVHSEVTITSAPRRREETAGTLRVVYASDDGTRLIAARFLDPIADAQQDPAD